LAGILYVETNFLIGIAKGQSPAAQALLASCPAQLRLAIPGVCFMEAYSVWKQESKQRRDFLGKLQQPIREASRDVTSPSAKSLSFHLQQAEVDGQALLNDIGSRLDFALDQTSKVAEVIDLTTSIVQEALKRALIDDDPTDNLILECILSHARSRPSELKAFLSGNHNDFEKSVAANDALDALNMRYFSRTEAALGWFKFMGIY